MTKRRRIGEILKNTEKKGKKAQELNFTKDKEVNKIFKPNQGSQVKTKKNCKDKLQVKERKNHETKM